ncbi:MAG: hypothetical protein K6F82_03445 [Sphaerochaetaceae bacterium]|nr:hypothetical protein [Sphaerochaetaceae bacterium]
MNEKIKESLNYWTAVVLLFAIVGCSMDSGLSSVSGYSASQVKTKVASVIDEEMDTIKPHLDSEVQGELDGTRGSSLTGADIVEFTEMEENGAEYIDLCYEVDASSASYDYSEVVDVSRRVLTDDQFQVLEKKIVETEKAIRDKLEPLAKDIPLSQQEDFYSDLEAFVVRSVVLLAASAVYSYIPDTVLWGKITAAAAIAVGAGLVAMIAMEVYRDINGIGPSLNLGSEASFQDWLTELLKTPQADYALTTAVTSVATSLGMSPTSTAICLAVFGIFNATDMIRALGEKYDFNI